MIRKICPVCDQVMKTQHYCRNCRSWVKEPYVRDVEYYLNERHPAGETVCSYHTAPAAHPGAVRTASQCRRSGASAALAQAEQQSAKTGSTVRTASDSGWRPPQGGQALSWRGSQSSPRDNRFPPTYGMPRQKPQKNYAVILVVCVVSVFFIVQILFAAVKVSLRMNDVYDSFFEEFGYDADLGDDTEDEWQDEQELYEQELTERGEQHL